MMKVLKWSGLVLLLLIALFLVAAAMQPDNYRVVRSATIAAPAAAVFEAVNDFHNWEAWSPWAKLDPAAKNTYEGPSSGEGSIFKWSGNDDVGEGSMTILKSQPHEQIQIKLAFIRPFEDSADVQFDFQAEGEQTTVTWSMSGENNFIGKIFCLFMDMEQMIGGDYEKGLAAMKSVVEAKQQAPAQGDAAAPITPAAP